MEHISKQLQQVKIEIQKSEEQALTVSKHSKTGDLLPALEGGKIFKLEDITPIKEVLRYCMLLVGVRANNLPGDIEKQVLIKFITDNYGGHTVEEIRLAFDMAISGKLEIDDVSCYENFSPAYFGRIMNAFRKWAIQQYNQEVKEEFVQKNYSEDELRKQQRQRAAEFYYRIKNGNVERVPDDVKDILVYDGKIEKIEDAEVFFVNLLKSGSNGLYFEKID